MTHFSQQKTSAAKEAQRQQDGDQGGPNCAADKNADAQRQQGDATDMMLSPHKNTASCIHHMQQAVLCDFVSRFSS